jgi:hypothetical protein
MLFKDLCIVPKKLWDCVFPGDLITCFGHVAFPYLSFQNRDQDTRVFHLRNHPVVVLSRIDSVVDDKRLTEQGFGTFVVLSRHGILVMLQEIKEV